MRFERFLRTLADTEALGRLLADRLSPGAVVALIGPLGAGKTTLTRAIATGLGVNPAIVSSPTFALVHEYPGRWPVYHFDAYRLPDVAAFVDLGAEDYFRGAGVCLVEWADRVEAALPAEYLRVELSHDGAGRRVVIEGIGKRYSEIVGDLD